MGRQFGPKCCHSFVFAGLRALFEMFHGTLVPYSSTWFSGSTIYQLSNKSVNKMTGTHCVQSTKIGGGGDLLFFAAAFLRSPLFSGVANFVARGKRSQLQRRFPRSNRGTCDLSCQTRRGIGAEACQSNFFPPVSLFHTPHFYFQHFCSDSSSVPARRDPCCWDSRIFFVLSEKRDGFV